MSMLGVRPFDARIEGSFPEYPVRVKRFFAERYTLIFLRMSVFAGVKL